MKFITSNKKTEIIGTTTLSIENKTRFSEIEINILMELSIHRNTYESVSDSDIAPQFQSEN